MSIRIENYKFEEDNVVTIQNDIEIVGSKAKTYLDFLAMIHDRDGSSTLKNMVNRLETRTSSLYQLFLDDIIHGTHYIIEDDNYKYLIIVLYIQGSLSIEEESPGIIQYLVQIPKEKDFIKIDDIKGVLCNGEMMGYINHIYNEMYTVLSERAFLTIGNHTINILSTHNSDFSYIFNYLFEHHTLPRVLYLYGDIWSVDKNHSTSISATIKEGYIRKFGPKDTHSFFKSFNKGAFFNKTGGFESLYVVYLKDDYWGVFFTRELAESDVRPFSKQYNALFLDGVLKLQDKYAKDFRAAVVSQKIENGKFVRKIIQGEKNLSEIIGLELHIDTSHILAHHLEDKDSIYNMFRYRSLLYRKTFIDFVDYISDKKEEHAQELFKEYLNKQEVSLYYPLKLDNVYVIKPVDSYCFVKGTDSKFKLPLVTPKRVTYPYDGRTQKTLVVCMDKLLLFKIQPVIRYQGKLYSVNYSIYAAIPDKQGFASLDEFLKANHKAKYSLVYSAPYVESLMAWSYILNGAVEKTLNREFSNELYSKV